MEQAFCYIVVLYFLNAWTIGGQRCHSCLVAGDMIKTACQAANALVHSAKREDMFGDSGEETAASDSESGVVSE